MADPITAEVIRSKFEALLLEMRFVLFRSAFSALMRESRDCSFGICSADGDMPFQGAPNHLFMYSRAARRLLTKWPAQEVHDGDIFIGNDPHEIGISHSPDVMVLAPVLHEGALVGFCGSIAHKSDFGGAVPGSVYSGATELYQEGLVLPLMKYQDRGRMVSQVEEVIRANVRNPDLVLGDLGAQVGATLLGVGRVRALAARYGAETLLAVARELLEVSEKRLRPQISRWPGRTAEAEVVLDPPPNHDGPVHIRLRVTRDDGHLTFDFTESDPQVRSPVNVPTTALMHVCCTCLVGMTDPTIPHNEGVARAITLKIKAGTVVCPTPPAPVGNTTRVRPRLADVVLNALAALKGERAVAQRGDCGSSAFGWRTGLVAGRRYIQYEIQNGAGTGATSWCDGVSGVNPYDYSHNGGSLDTRGLPDTPVEVLEAQYPVRVRKFELVPDSGGPGQFRGGASRRRLYEALAPADLNVRHAMGWVIPPQGMEGGLPGRSGRVVINVGTPAEVNLETWSHELQPGDTLSFESPGGGGFGNPFQREPQAVLRDVVEGFVSPEGAHTDYGVVVQAAGSSFVLDLPATRRLRSARRQP
ncbi:MAG: hydantoinase B/oxoprolinase family protein [Chloroflexi bacterium]|nr:hydantoinase B/oxoprolinase family protein [Chloroflexota bacterium]